MPSNIIDPKRNKAKVESEVFSGNQLPLHIQYTNSVVKDAGVKLQPDGFEYVGSACIHYYKSKFKDHEYVTKIQDLLGDVPEGFADFGYKQLRNAMMTHYGRENPRERK